MKLRFFFLLALLLSAFAELAAQDTIIKKNGDEVEARVMEVSPSEVRYREFSKPDGPIYILQRADVFMIRYQNGTKDVFNEPEQEAPETSPSGTVPQQPQTQPAQGGVQPAGYGVNAQQMYQQGVLDGRRYYKGRGPMWWTAGATAFFPPAGLIVGGIIAAVPPNVDNQTVSDRYLLNDPNYRAGYKRQAHKRKLGKAATGFGIGMGALIVLSILTFQQ